MNEMKHNLVQYILLLFIPLLFFLRIYEVFTFEMPELNGMFNQSMNYEQKRLTRSMYIVPIEAAKFMPENAGFELSISKWELKRIAAKYILYPRRLSRDWSYWIDFDGVFDDSQQSYKKLSIGSIATVYAKPGSDFVFQEKPTVYYSLVKVIMVVMITTLLYILIGFLECLVLNLHFRRGGLLWFLSTNYLLGLFTSSFIFWLLMIFGVPFSRTTVAGVWVSVLFLLYWSVKGKVLNMIHGVEYDS